MIGTQGSRTWHGCRGRGLDGCPDKAPEPARRRGRAMAPASAASVQPALAAVGSADGRAWAPQTSAHSISSYLLPDPSEPRKADRGTERPCPHMDPRAVRWPGPTTRDMAYESGDRSPLDPVSPTVFHYDPHGRRHRPPSPPSVSS